MTAFVSLVFGYFFYWTSGDDFPPESSSADAGSRWLISGSAALLVAWVMTLLARRFNRRDRPAAFYTAVLLAAALSALGAAALVAGPWNAGLDPKSHVYAATVWILVLWTVGHAAAGTAMHLYCAARRAAGRMTARHDIDIVNVALYWHFAALTVAITVGVIVGFPLVA